MFLYRGFSLLHSENPLILHFPGLLSKYFLSKLKLLDKIHSKMKIYLEIPPKNGIKVGIHFYENIPSEINLPLKLTFMES